jgi:hypothetical protein
MKKRRAIAITVGRMTIVGFERKKSGILTGKINSVIILIVHRPA